MFHILQDSSGEAIKTNHDNVLNVKHEIGKSSEMMQSSFVCFYE